MSNYCGSTATLSTRPCENPVPTSGMYCSRHLHSSPRQEATPTVGGSGGVGHTLLPVPALLALVPTPTADYGDGFAAREAEDRAYEAEHGPTQEAATRATTAARLELNAAWDAFQGTGQVDYSVEDRNHYAAREAYTAAEAAERAAYAREDAIEDAQGDYRIVEQDEEAARLAAVEADDTYAAARRAHKDARTAASRDAMDAAGANLMAVEGRYRAATAALRVADDEWPATLDAARAVR